MRSLLFPCHAAERSIQEHILSIIYPKGDSADVFSEKKRYNLGDFCITKEGYGCDRYFCSFFSLE
jgi:hypothetical protein